MYSLFMRLFILLFLAIASSSSALGFHLNKIDSLKSMVYDAKGRQKVALLNQVGWEFRKFAPDSTIYYSKKALTLSKQIKDRRGETTALSYIGVAYRYLAVPSQALYYFRSALQIAKANKDTMEIAYSYNNIASIYQGQGDYPEAYRNYDTALSLFEKIKHEEGIAYAYSGLSKTYRAEGNLPNAITASQQAIVIRREISEPMSLATELLRLSELLTENKQYDQVLPVLQEARTLTTAQGLEVLLAMSNSSLAKFYTETENYLKALEYAKKAELQYDTIKNPYGQNKTHLLLAEIYINLNQLNEADGYLNTAIKEAKANQYVQLLSQCYQLVSQLKETQGDFEKSLFYHKLYLSSRDSSNSIKNRQALEKLQRNIAIMQRERELDQLKQKEAINQEKMKQEEAKILALLILLGLFILLLAMLVRSNQKQRKTNNILQTQKKQIESQHESIQQKNKRLEMANQQLEAINQEKDSLMGIVAHDLKSPLNKVKGYTQILQMLGNLEGEEKMIVTDIDKVVEGGRKLIQDLLDIHTAEYRDETSLNLEEFEVNSLVQETLNSFTAAAKQKEVSLIYSEPDYSLSMTSDTGCLSRILENLISNAIKFSDKGSNVYVSLHDNDGKVQVMIRDEGPGFTEADQQKAFQKFQKLSARPTNGESSTGLGLAIVKLLLEQVQGEISLYSEYGNGTEFIIELPRTITK